MIFLGRSGQPGDGAIKVGMTEPSADSSPSNALSKTGFRTELKHAQNDDRDLNLDTVEKAEEILTPAIPTSGAMRRLHLFGEDSAKLVSFGQRQLDSGFSFEEHKNFQAIRIVPKESEIEHTPAVIVTGKLSEVSGVISIASVDSTAYGQSALKPEETDLPVYERRLFYTQIGGVVSSALVFNKTAPLGNSDPTAGKPALESLLGLRTQADFFADFSVESSRVAIRTDVSSHSAPQAQPPAVQQVLAAIHGGKHSNHIEVRLDPPELGKVRINFSFDASGAVTAIISAENDGTLNLMRRYSDGFLRDLESAGFIGVQLEFSSDSPADSEARSRQHQLSFDEPNATAPVPGAIIYLSARTENCLDRLV